MSSPTPSSDQEVVSIPVIEERLEVGRRVVDSGPTLRVRKHVEEVPAPVNEAVAHEYVDVQRVPIGRVVDTAPAVRDEGDVMVIPVVEERLVTRKELVLVEEIRLTRRREVRDVQADVTLRRERVVIERLDRESGQWLSSPDEG